MHRDAGSGERECGSPRPSWGPHLCHQPCILSQPRSLPVPPFAWNGTISSPSFSLMTLTQPSAGYFFSPNLKAGADTLSWTESLPSRTAGETLSQPCPLFICLNYFCFVSFFSTAFPVLFYYVCRIDFWLKRTFFWYNPKWWNRVNRCIICDVVMALGGVPVCRGVGVMGLSVCSCHLPKANTGTRESAEAKSSCGMFPSSVAVKGKWQPTGGCPSTTATWQRPL